MRKFEVVYKPNAKYEYAEVVEANDVVDAIKKFKDLYVTSVRNIVCVEDLSPGSLGKPAPLLSH